MKAMTTETLPLQSLCMLLNPLRGTSVRSTHLYSSRERCAGWVHNHPLPLLLLLPPRRHLLGRCPLVQRWSGCDVYSPSDWLYGFGALCSAGDAPGIFPKSEILNGTRSAITSPALYNITSQHTWLRIYLQKYMQRKLLCFIVKAFFFFLYLHIDFWKRLR